MLLFVVSVLLTALLAPPLAYYVWMKNMAKRSWNLTINNNHQPKVSLIIPTYNEASVIGRKLENIQRMDYPEDKLQVILVDSASTDGTLTVCKEFLERNTLRFPVRLLSERKRMGKSHALNIALEYADGEIIATSDADSFWELDVLRKVVSFFADPSIGAVMGREKLINYSQTIHTLSEGLYRKFFYTLRLGESKVHSTLFFQGELALYRKSAFEKFEDRAGYSDDIGTVTNIVSHGFRCIFVPEAVFHDTAAYSLRGRLMLKSRRAQHLIAGIMETLKLKAQRELPLPLAIVILNLHMHVVSPLLLVVTVFVVVLHFQMLLCAMFSLLLLLIFRKPRLFIVSYLTSNLALIIGLIRSAIGKREAAWPKIEEMRAP